MKKYILFGILFVASGVFAAAPLSPVEQSLFEIQEISKNLTIQAKLNPSLQVVLISLRSSENGVDEYVLQLSDNSSLNVKVQFSYDTSTDPMVPLPKMDVIDVGNVHPNSNANCLQTLADPKRP